MNDSSSEKSLMMGVLGVILVIAIIFGIAFFYQNNYFSKKPSPETKKGQDLLTSPFPTGTPKNPFTQLDVTQGTITAINQDAKTFTIEKPAISEEARKTWPENLRKELPTKKIIATVFLNTDTRLVAWTLYEDEGVNLLLSNYFYNKARAPETPFPKLYSSETPMEVSDFKKGDKVFILGEGMIESGTVIQAKIIAKQVPKK